MNILPLVLREMSVATRRGSTRRLRLGFGGGTIAVVLWAFLVWTGGGNAGQMIFHGLTLVAVAGVLLISVFLASDSLSREKREGTFGFLFLTDLHAGEIIIGKLAAMALVPGYTLLAMFPGFGVCALAGALTGGEFFRTMISLVVTLLFALSSSIFVSALCVKQRSAQALSALWLIVLNPLLLCHAATDAAYATRPGNFWLLLLGAFTSASLLLLYSAGLIANRTWRGHESYETPKPAKVVVRGTREYDKEPVAWLMLRQLRTAPRKAQWVITGVGITLVFLLVPTRNLPEALLLLLFLACLVYEGMVLARTAHSFHQERQDGSLELLLGTRLDIGEVFNGFYKALLRHSMPALWILSLCNALVSILLAQKGQENFALFAWAMTATLWITFLSLPWFGVFRSLMSNHPIFAMLTTLAQLSAIPLAIAALLSFAPRVTVPQVLGLWVVLSGFLSIFFASDAKAALLKHGRALLLRPYSDKPPQIESEWSFINWDEADLASPPKQMAQTAA